MLPTWINYFQVKTIKPLSEPKKTYLLLAGFWTIFIAVLCLVSFNQLPKPAISGIDKYVHITLHFVFTILWACYLKAKSTDRLFLKVLMASIVYGILIEVAQETFTTTRHADILDVLANTTGSVLAIAAMCLTSRLLKKKN